MSQRLRRLASLSLVALLLPASATLGQSRFDDVEIVPTRVTDSVYMLKGAGGNMAVSIGEDGVVLVDDQFAPLTDKIRAAIKTLSEGEIRFVINTHWHGDHTGGNENLGGSGSVIVAHTNVHGRLSTPQVRGERTVGPSPKEALPVITFDRDLRFHLNGETLHAIHPSDRGHTDGDAILHFEGSNVIHCGDLYFQGNYPFIDQSSGGDVRGLLEALDRILELADDETVLIPGHGDLSDKAELQEYRTMVEGVHHAVAALVAAGKTEEEAVAAEPTAPWDERWGNGFINPETITRHIYRQLTSR